MAPRVPLPHPSPVHCVCVRVGGRGRLSSWQMTYRKGAAPAVGGGSRKDKTEEGDLLRERAEEGAGPG